MKIVPIQHDRDLVIRQLAARRPTSSFLRLSGLALLIIVVVAWLTADFRLSELISPRRLANVQRFMGELKPQPLQGRPWDWQIALQWLGTLMATKGGLAVAHTIAISITAVVLAGLIAAPLAFPASRSFTTASPYLPHAHRPSRLASLLWSGVVTVTRACLIFLRAVPEYIWAFLLIAVLGPTQWAAVFALALHNAGILAKLNAEAIENLEPASLASLRALGAHRYQIALAGIMPALGPRALLFFFYRWETCVREATVLGILGIVSLGYYIQDARSRQYYDVMFVLILLSSIVVLVGDLLSSAAREAVRRSQ
jgi:phosphonate transport system permease protein